MQQEGDSLDAGGVALPEPRLDVFQFLLAVVDGAMRETYS